VTNQQLPHQFGRTSSNKDAVRHQTNFITANPIAATGFGAQSSHLQAECIREFEKKSIQL
jgi:hypothetical protein